MSRYAGIRLEWRRHVEQWRDSGLSGAEFCRRRQLSLQRFYAWRHRLDANSPAPRESAPGDFVPMSFAPETGCCGVSVLICQHVRLELSRCFDQGELLRAVRALGELRSC